MTFNKTLRLFWKIRPLNINWQDLKYRAFAIVIYHSQKNLRHYALGECKRYSEPHRKHWIEIIISKLIFISVSFTLILKLDNNFNSTYHCVTIEYDVLHQSESYIKRLTCINVFSSVHETDGLKIEFEIGISIMCFRGRPPIAL